MDKCPGCNKYLCDGKCLTPNCKIRLEFERRNRMIELLQAIKHSVGFDMKNTVMKVACIWPLARMYYRSAGKTRMKITSMIKTLNSDAKLREIVKMGRSSLVIVEAEKRIMELLTE